LYWYRSPPAVKVGRPALDPEAIQAIERANPDITFDWAAILDARPPEPEPADGWRARRGRPGRDPEAREDRSAGTSRPVQQQPPKAPVPSVDRRARPRDSGAGQLPQPITPDAQAEAADNADTSPISSLEPTAVQRALGSEGLVRVRARYAEVIARISSQVADAGVADELRSLAERLNPDAWVTADEVREGLEGFERVLESVRQRLGPPRRRREGGQPVTAADPGHPPSPGPPDESSGSSTE